VAAVLSSTRAALPMETTEIPQQLRDLLESGQVRSPVGARRDVAAARLVADNAWKSCAWGSRHRDKNQLRGEWSDEEIDRIGVVYEGIRDRYPGKLYIP